jgi:hypothetical protein
VTRSRCGRCEGRIKELAGPLGMTPGLRRLTKIANDSEVVHSRGSGHRLLFSLSWNRRSRWERAMVFKFAIVMIMSFALCGPALGQRARGSGGIGDRITPGIGSTGSQGIGQGSGVGSLGDTAINPDYLRPNLSDTVIPDLQPLAPAIQAQPNQTRQFNYRLGNGRVVSITVPPPPPPPHAPHSGHAHHHDECNRVCYSGWEGVCWRENDCYWRCMAYCEK